jgi:transcriptional regulator with PAS, ATPase and Fis domain
MATEMRKTGVDVIGDMPWGTHFCLFYETRADLLETLVCYLKAGLENQEFCLWVVAEPISIEDATGALKRAIPGFDQYLSDQSIEIVAARDWYFPDGIFDLNRVIRGWNEKLARASAGGYAGVRVTGDTAWLEKKDWKDFCEYEESLNQAVANQHLAVLCTYPLAACGAAEILDVVRTHQFAVTRRRGGWDVVETAGHKQAKAEIKRLNEELEQRVRERTSQLTAANRELTKEVLQRQRAEAAQRRSEAYLAEAQRLTHTGSFGWRVSTGEILWSEETFRIFQYDRTTKPTVQLILHRVHARDIASVKQTIERASQDGKAFDHEYRLVMPDGSIKHVHVVAHALSDESGEREFVGAVTDMTAAKQAFEEIQKLKDQLYRENLALKEEVDQSSMFEEIVGSSEALRRVLAQVAKVAQFDSTVLILGETGTGKELIARAIHKRSNRSMNAFVRVNCAAIPPSLIASELFGYEKGAFTGALQRRLGRFELADGGTIFLDEVGELPAETQIALLRVIQEREFERVGGSQSISVDVRVLAATNRDLIAAVNSRTFRQDLFYRLNVFPIVMPPLRERLDDIPLLVEYLIERYAKKGGKNITSITKRTLDLFQAYDWPGNIRELQNVVERAIVLCEGDTFFVDETWLNCESPQEKRRPTTVERGLGRLDANREKEMIEAALLESKGRIAGPGGAADKLGIPRSTLESKIRTLGINKHIFKARCA